MIKIDGNIRPIEIAMDVGTTCNKNTRLGVGARPAAAPRSKANTEAKRN
tara:strand:+ start:317 stop:463 length:147 start_codon:yes stop_codon:yes gene_type:complete